MTNKTQPTDIDVATFLETIANDSRRAEAERLVAILSKLSGDEGKMWGASIVGFGKYHYRYASGREGDAPAVGFSPRVQNLTLYITGGFDGLAEALERLGKHKLGKGCLYIKKLSDLDEDALTEILRHSLAKARQFDTPTSP